MLETTTRIRGSAMDLLAIVRHVAGTPATKAGVIRVRSLALTTGAGALCHRRCGAANASSTRANAAPTHAPSCHAALTRAIAASSSSDNALIPVPLTRPGSSHSTHASALVFRPLHRASSEKRAVRHHVTVEHPVERYCPSQISSPPSQLPSCRRMDCDAGGSGQASRRRST